MEYLTPLRRMSDFTNDKFEDKSEKVRFTQKQ